LSKIENIEQQISNYSQIKEPSKIFWHNNINILFC